MTDAEKITYLKMKDNAKESPEALSAALLTAKYAIMTRAYPYKQNFDNIEFPSKYDMLQVDIANVLLKKIGAEGETQHSENGIERIYESADIPQSMLSVIVPNVGVL